MRRPIEAIVLNKGKDLFSCFALFCHRFVMAGVVWVTVDGTQARLDKYASEKGYLQSDAIF